MKHLLILLLGTLSAQFANAQIVDDFNDNDLSAAPQWLGVNSNFTNLNGILKSNSNLTNCQFALSTNFNLSGDLEWRLNVKLSFNPSSLNYIDFFLFADSLNLVKAKNGFFVRMGGSTDEISVYKLTNGVESKFIDGKDGLLNTSSSQYTLSVVYKGDSLALKHQKQGQTNAVLEGIAYAPNLPFSNYSGIRVRQSTSSFFYKHSFDDLYIGPLIKDSIPPYCDSLKILSPKTIALFFSEDCDSFSISKSNVFLLNGSTNCDSVKVIGANQVVLVYKDTLAVNKLLVLDINGVKDYFGNTIKHSKTFIRYLTERPRHWDILFSELMVDPDPPIGLPNKEYVEISNVSDKFIYLDELSIGDLSSNILLPHVVLPPDSFYVLYTIPSLNNTADNIFLKSKFGETIDEINYNDSWYHDGVKKLGGYSLERIDLSRPCLGPENWSASKSLSGGTPNCINSIAAKMPIDSIGPKLVTYLTSQERYLSFVFSEKIDTSNGPQIRIKNNNLNLLPNDLKGPIYRYKWPYLPSKDSLFLLEIGGLKDCEQNMNSAISLNLQWPSIAQKNEIVVNEILFNPKPNGKDFIELFNNSNKTFDLSTLYFVELDANGMPLTYYPISSKYKLFKPQTYALITEDTISVCKTYTCAFREAVYCQVNKLIGMPDKEGKVLVYNQLNLMVDSVSYTADWHFKFLNDQNGVSIERLSPNMESNDENTWHSAAYSVAYASPGRINSQISIPLATDKYFSLNSKSLSPDMDGFEDLLILRYKLPQTDYLSTIKIFNIEGREIKTVINNKTLGTEGTVVWDGTDYTGEVLPIGVYLVLIECMSPNGELHREKLSVILARNF